MTDPDRIDVKHLIQQIRATGKSYHYISKLLRVQVVQVQRMEKSGRCQPHQRDMLVMILADATYKT